MRSASYMGPATAKWLHEKIWEELGVQEQLPKERLALLYQAEKELRAIICVAQQYGELPE